MPKVASVAYSFLLLRIYLESIYHVIASDISQKSEK